MQLVDRVLTAIEVLSREDNGLSVSELSEKLEIPASSTHRVLKSLQDNHFVIQDQETKKYRLSYKIFTLCAGMKESNSLVTLARPFMRQLAEDIGKPVVLCVMSGDQIMNLDCIENSDASIYMVKTGKELPLYATSAGRVFAAFMDRGRAEEILKRTIRRQETPYTKTDLLELFGEMEQIRRQGYAVIDEELQIGIQGVSCPVTDSNGRVVAAIGMTTLKSENAIDEYLVEQLKRCASRISKEIS